jgi:hypothetical protein
LTIERPDKVLEHSARFAGRVVAYDATVSVTAANGIALALLPVSYLLSLLPFQRLWGTRLLVEFIGSTSFAMTFILALLVGGIFHELQHAAGFFPGWGSASDDYLLRFRLEGLVPIRSLPGTRHRKRLQDLGVVAWRPAWPTDGSRWLVAGSVLITHLGAIITVAAGGDLAVLWATRSVAGTALVADHPKIPGVKSLRIR